MTEFDYAKNGEYEPCQKCGSAVKVEDGLYHTCPFGEEIHGDSSLCNCCTECCQACQNEI